MFSFIPLPRGERDEEADVDVSLYADAA